MMNMLHSLSRKQSDLLPHHSSQRSISSGYATGRRKQSNRLQQVRWQTLVVVITADVLLVIALLYQVLWLSASLHETLRTKVSNTIRYLEFRYNERLNDMILGSTLYMANSSTSSCCLALDGDRKQINELHQRFLSEQSTRGTEIIALLDRGTSVVSSPGPESANGFHINPQNIISNYIKFYDRSSEQLKASVTVDKVVFMTLHCPELDVKGDYRPDLATWTSWNQTAVRMTISPLFCATDRPQGFIIMIDSINRRQYDFFNHLVLETKSSLLGVVVRLEDGSWLNAYSFNKPGSVGAKDEFPDLTDYVESSELERAVQKQGEAISGTVSIEGITYTYAMTLCPPQMIGSQVADKIPRAPYVYIYAEPRANVHSVILTSIASIIPLGLFIIILSLATLKFTYVKFLDPMKTLVKTVKKSSSKQFHEAIAQMKLNRSLVWGLLFQALVVQGALLCLIFVNRELLSGVLPDFTSASSEGRVMSYIVSTRSRNMMQHLLAWSAFDEIINPARTMNSTREVEESLIRNAIWLDVGAISILGLDSVVISSSKLESIGETFPEPGIMSHLESPVHTRIESLMSLSAWTKENVDMFTAGMLPGTENTPPLARLIGAPINILSSNATTDTLKRGRLLGALVLVDLMNGKDSVWDNALIAFNNGYYGMFAWNRYADEFSRLTSVLKGDNGITFGVELPPESRDLLSEGMHSAYQKDKFFIKKDVVISGERFITSMTPFIQKVDTILSPSAVNAFLVRGVPQAQWDELLERQLMVQIGIMAIVLLASLVSIVLTYLPMKQFLQSMEQEFKAPSASEHRRESLRNQGGRWLNEAATVTARDVGYDSGNSQQNTAVNSIDPLTNN